MNDSERQNRFEAEIMPHAETLRAYSLTLARDPNDAQDLHQETMLKAYRNLHQLAENTNPRAWTFTIMRHTFINTYRKRGRAPIQQGLFVESGAEHHELTSIPSAEDMVMDSITDKRLKIAMASMPKEFARTVYLADVHGFSYKEIAAYLKIPAGTVMSRLHRGRKALRKAYTDEQVAS